MSHQPHRKEKNCLNCGATVSGPFCQQCGQENIVTQQHFGSLARHFVYDIFHFDGKFFATLGYLFSRPGFVPKEYTAGRRQRYLDPIRMYLFTSAVFFLVFFKAITPEVHIDKREKNSSPEPVEKGQPAATLNSRPVAATGDSEELQLFRFIGDNTRPVQASQTTAHTFSIGEKRYSTLANYDSIQHSKPASEKDSWAERLFIRRILQVREKYNYNGSEIVKALSENFLHHLPYLLFVSLPFFALLLKLIYTKRKDLYYSDHATFTLYHFIFSFILLLLFFILNALHQWLQWGLFGWLITAGVIFGGYYLWRSLQVFYGSSRKRAFANTLAIGVAGVAELLVLFLVFMLFSFFEL